MSVALSAVPTDAPAQSSAIARGVAAGAFHIVVATVAGPIQTALLLRHLPATEAGFWFVVVSLTNYLALFDLGVGPTLTRHVAFICGRGAAEQLPAIAREVAAARRLYWLLSIALVASALALGPVLVPLLAKRSFDLAVGSVWTLFAIGSAANLLASLAFATLAGLGVVGINRLARALAQVLGLALMALTLQAGWGVVGVALVWCAQNFVLLAVGRVVLARTRPDVARSRAPVDGAVVRAFVGPSLRWAGMNLGATLILASGPMMLSWGRGPEAVPPYMVMMQLVGALYTIALLPASATEPFVARAHGGGDRRGVVSLLERNARHITSVLLVGATLLAVFGREIITLWVGAQYFAGPLVLALFLVLYVLEAHHVVHASVIMATGRVVFLPWALIAGAINVTLGLYLVKPFGALGVIAATVAAQLLTNNWFAPWYTLSRLHVSWREYATAILPAVPVGLVVALAALVARAAFAPLGQSHPALALGGGIGAAALAGVLALWSFALTDDERAASRSTARRLLAALAGRS